MALSLIPVAAALVPDILRLVAADPAGLVAAAAAEAVHQVLGTADPVAARAALAADPGRAAALRARLTEIALQGARLAAETRPVGEGRRGAASLAGLSAGGGTARAARGGASAWGPVTVSTLVVLGFFSVLALLVSINPPAEGGPRFDPQVASVINITVGTLGAAFAAVVNFWIGSSQSSRNKDALVGRLQEVQLQARLQGPPQAPQGAAISADPPAPALSLVSRVAQRPAEDRFDACLDHVLAAEGGFVNNPADPGGATNLGITRRTLSDFRDVEATEADVRALTRAEAREIYRARYWIPMRCAELPPGVDLMVFDFGVNAGPGRSLRLLQGSVGVKADGSIGPITLAAARACRGAELIGRLAAGRMAYYRGLDGFQTFGRGWTRRVEGTRQAALGMSAGGTSAIAMGTGATESLAA
ncbi:glycoside hydrolase family 108 protein [Muricoccus aerilatus]|uniref:glycoside hydrolase family 108 protein n=1 Tax=Muricoccus aerilatus TaxID=452982 RepID=UPI000A01DB10|nr:glycosyl hydrolase 108 family protein [Roseomonas aerilata]